MAYQKQSWSDNAAGGTPISAARLNYMEQGIEEAHALAGSGGGGGGGGTADTVIAYSTLTVMKGADNSWPLRPTDRPDVIVAWKGPDPSPPIISSGIGGMLDNVDYRLVTP